MAILRSHNDVRFPGKSVAILRVSKGVRLLRKREDKTIVRLRKLVRDWGKLGKWV
jgi:hypothetical protein